MSRSTGSTRCARRSTPSSARGSHGSAPWRPWTTRGVPASARSSAATSRTMARCGSPATPAARRTARPAPARSARSPSGCRPFVSRSGSPGSWASSRPASVANGPGPRCRTGAVISLLGPARRPRQGPRAPRGRRGVDGDPPDVRTGDPQGRPGRTPRPEGAPPPSSRVAGGSVVGRAGREPVRGDETRFGKGFTPSGGLPMRGAGM